MPHEDQAAQLLHMCRGPRSVLRMLPVDSSLSVDPFGVRLVEAVGFLTVSLTPVTPTWVHTWILGTVLWLPTGVSQPLEFVNWYC